MKIESPVLKRLGPIPFWRGLEKCLPQLERIYRRAQESAQMVLENGATAGKEQT